MSVIYSSTICTRCLMDRSDCDIVFDKDGVCSNCKSYENLEKKSILKGKDGTLKWEETVQQLKQQGKNKPYDAIIGISGGVDSSYLSYLASQVGLRCLAVHFDNGWNSKIASKNIQNIIKNTGFDFHTLVVDWNEFRDLQQAYFKANVLDLDVPADHAIVATLYKLAHSTNCNYILSGFNLPTEGILPRSWNFNKLDSWNLKDIYSRFGTLKKMNSYPILNFWMKKRLISTGKVKVVMPLNWLPYSTDHAKKIITEKLQWEDYGGKHYESIFTRFYQGYILPQKFNIDKRKAHLSTLIMSGSISREEGINELKKPIYDAELLKQDYDFVIKKLGFTPKEFDAYIRGPVVSHFQYSTEPKSVVSFIKLFLRGKKIYS